MAWFVRIAWVLREKKLKMFKVKEGYEGVECGWAVEEAFNKAIIIWND